MAIEINPVALLTYQLKSIANSANLAHFCSEQGNWQCCLACSFKVAPRILIFSITMDADNSFELNSIETYAPQFNGHNKIFLGSVYCACCSLPKKPINQFQLDQQSRLDAIRASCPNIYTRLETKRSCCRPKSVSKSEASILLQLSYLYIQDTMGPNIF